MGVQRFLNIDDQVNKLHFHHRSNGENLFYHMILDLDSSLGSATNMLCDLGLGTPDLSLSIVRSRNPQPLCEHQLCTSDHDERSARSL